MNILVIGSGDDYISALENMLMYLKERERLISNPHVGFEHIEGRIAAIFQYEIPEGGDDITTESLPE